MCRCVVVQGEGLIAVVFEAAREESESGKRGAKKTEMRRDGAKRDAPRETKRFDGGGQGRAMSTGHELERFMQTRQ